MGWEYRYSSAGYRVNLIKEDKLLSNYESIDDIEDYKSFLQEVTEEKQIIEKTRTGKPCGDEKFYEKILLTTGVDYKSKKPGPKQEMNN